jgi:hypothetical protein
MTESSDTTHELIPSMPKLTLLPTQGATVVKLRPPKVEQRPLPVPCEVSPSSKADKIEHEKNSQILKTAVTYCCSKATAAASFVADHTGESLFAGYDGIVGGAHLDKAERSLRKLIKLMNRSDDLLTVELWSLASVTGFILREADEPGIELEEEQREYLKSFVRVVERQCHTRYEQEWAAAHSSRS